MQLLNFTLLHKLDKKVSALFFQTGFMYRLHCSRFLVRAVNKSVAEITKRTCYTHGFINPDFSGVIVTVMFPICYINLIRIRISMLQHCNTRIIGR